MKITQHKNGYYYAQIWTREGPTSISLQTKSKVEARNKAKAAMMAEFEAAAKVNALTSETITRILMGKRQTGQQVYKVWLGWANNVGLTPNTRHRYGSYIQLFLEKSGFAESSLAACTDEEIDAFVNPPNSGIVANTRRSRLCAMQSFFAVAHSKGFTAGDPSKLVKVKLSGLTHAQKEPRTKEPFNEMELAKLRTIDDPFWKTFVLLGEHYGLRVGDVAQLERETIAKPGVFIIHTDKGDKRLPPMPLHPEVARHLHSLPVESKKYFFPEYAKMVTDVKQRSKLSTYFGRIIGRMGIEGKNTHNLRHTFATKRKDLGDTVDEIRLKMGHESEGTTLGYIHG